MEGRGDIKIDTRPAPARAPRWAGPVAAALVLLVIGVLVTLGGFRESSEVGPEDTVPDLGPDLLETALLVVEDFAAAWNRGDATGAERLIVEDWDSVVLPGFAYPWFGPRDGRAALREAIGFLASVSRLPLGSCDAELAPPGSRATAVVHCGEAGFRGDYLDAVRRNIWEEFRHELAAGRGERVPGMSFGIREDRIISIEADIDTYAPQAYCIWAEEMFPEEAGPSFDLHCRPKTAGGNGATHARLAEAFMAAGAPLASPQLAEARLAASYVDRYVELHNLADTTTAGSWLSSGVSAADLPGFPDGVEEPGIADYLPWSARLNRIETGECAVELGDDLTIVTCPEMAVAGPLFGEPIPQPTRFAVDSNRRGNPIARAQGRIISVEPLSDDRVPAVAGCRRLQRSNPDFAARAFAEDCRPVFVAPNPGGQAAAGGRE